MKETIESSVDSVDKEKVIETVPIYDTHEIEINRQEHTPSQLRSMLNNIRNQFKNAFKISSDTNLLKERLDEEIKEASSEAMHDGVDFSLCQMNEIIDDYNSGRTVEFESFSPYLSDYNLATGEIWKDKLTDTDKIGIGVAKALSEVFPKARLISLYDEYNTDMPDSANFYGQPKKAQTDERGQITTDKKGNPIDAPQLKLSDEVKNNFKNNIEKLLREKEVLLGDDREGENYLFISESDKIIDAEELVKQLEANGNIKREGKAIYFTNPDAENPAYREITLRTINGRWLCEALDASSYIKPENLDITHLVVLPEEFKEQQNKVWEMLRVLGIDSTHYHNIFFDQKQDPRKIVEAIKKEIEKYK